MAIAFWVRASGRQTDAAGDAVMVVERVLSPAEVDELVAAAR